MADQNQKHCRGRQTEKFNGKYALSGAQGDALVVIRSEMNGLSLRVKPNELGRAECQGGFGGFARWRVSVKQGVFQFSSVKSGKFLRIHQHGGGAMTVDASGSGGRFTQFRLHTVGECNVAVFAGGVVEAGSRTECLFRVMMKDGVKEKDGG